MKKPKEFRAKTRSAAERSKNSVVKRSEFFAASAGSGVRWGILKKYDGGYLA